MTEANPGDTIYITKRAKAVGAIVKVRTVKNDRHWWAGTVTSSHLTHEKYLLPAEYEATEQAARDKAEQAITKEIAAIERRLTKLRGFAGNIKTIDRT